MGKYLRILACLLFLSFLAACGGKKNLIVLVPEPDGNVGEVEVSTKGGSQSLNRSYEATEVKSAEKAPGAPFIMNPNEVSEIFKSALDAQPQKPLTFIFYFESNSTALTQKSKEILPRILAAIRDRNSKDVSIVGHADTSGSKDYNFKLSLQRTAAVSDQLLSLGVDPDIFDISSHGEGNPLVKTDDDTPEPRNRRVEVIVR